MEPEPESTLQEGIHHLEKTPDFFALLLLREREGATAKSVHALLAKLWKMYTELKNGFVHDLPGTVVKSGRFYVLLGFGPRAFKLDGARTMPKALETYGFDPPLPGGGAIVRDTEGQSGIRYVDGLKENPADVAVAIQFTGATPLSVERPIVETSKLLRREGETASLEIARFTLRCAFFPYFFAIVSSWSLAN